MNGKPSFLIVRFLTKYHFSLEVKENIASFIAKEILEIFHGLDCSILFENPISFQMFYDQNPPVMENITNHPELRPKLYLEVLSPVGSESKDVCSEEDLNNLKKKLQENSFLKNVVIFT